jgi:hypothetical protein
MDKKITLESIIKKEEDIRSLGFDIQNNIIEEVNVNTIAHFGNVTCLEIYCTNIWPMCTYNNTLNLGLLIRALIELLGISAEDGLSLSEIKNIPCRLVFNDTDCWCGSKCIGIGHFMKDKFVPIEDFVLINER